MTTYNKLFTSREELVQTVKDLGQSVIEQAEDIVGNANCLTDLNITLQVNVIDGYPTIHVSRSHGSMTYICKLVGKENIK